MFMEDHRNAVAVLKNSFPIPDSKPENFSTSLLWVVSGMTTLTKVNIYAYVHNIIHAYVYNASHSCTDYMYLPHIHTCIHCGVWCNGLGHKRTDSKVQYMCNDFVAVLYSILFRNGTVQVLFIPYLSPRWVWLMRLPWARHWKPSPSVPALFSALPQSLASMRMILMYWRVSHSQ